jgi:tRNA(fMet)-specific endonuclease VapC
MRNQVLLDTDIVLFFWREHEIVLQHATDYIISFGKLSFTELTWYEVIRGYKAIGAYRQLETFNAFCQDCNILLLDHKALDYAATIYADLRRRGSLIGEMDILIAGIALANGMGVATRNIDHFSRIHGLYVEDWTL